MHRGDRAGLGDPGLETHQHRVTTPMGGEDFLARQRDLDRPVGHQRELGGDDLVIERIALPAEAAAVRAGDDPDPRGGHVQDFRRGPVEVVRGLGARPDGELAVGVHPREGGVLLHRQMGVALEEKGVLENLGGLGEAFLHVAELEGHFLVGVPLVGVVVDLGLGVGEGLFG